MLSRMQHKMDKLRNDRFILRKGPNSRLKQLITVVALGSLPVAGIAQSRSAAREWNEVLLEAIRNDVSRPTIHARNLFHSAIMSYDGWAAYDDLAQPFLLGNSFAGVVCAFEPIPAPEDLKAARSEAISYANYRLLSHRFVHSPSADQTLAMFDSLMTAMGYDRSFTSTQYQSGSPAALGNYLAQCMLDAGLNDGSNEQDNYANLFYEEFNPPLLPVVPGNPDIIDPNRFQPLGLKTFVDQGGNVFATGVPPFLSPEWGRVAAFALSPEDLTVQIRDGDTYDIYHDPGPPPFIDPNAATTGTGDYQWAFEIVSTWSSHLDPTDGVLWDISPASIGNNPPLPTTIEEMKAFYDFENGGDQSRGRSLNPYTGLPYEPQIVPRGDYTRVLAEFWADGPDSETPPGHWFTILNYVSDHPLFEKRYRGRGEILDDLEWDVKSYLALGGAVHDAAVSAWSVKGWYDYVRPISAIRYMADQGQCTDPSKANYAVNGIHLIDGLIETVNAGDPLEGLNGENVGKIKLMGWRGPDYVIDPNVDDAGVGWILAENWWPYQRPTFVTPPFAGYVSGHSTFSRAAAEVMTAITGDEYFPGGMGEFHAPTNEFLVFEDGPSVDVTLQWATYRDASDQTSLSRIWGGIHPPVDDIPGRHMGIDIGQDAMALAERYFLGLAETDDRPTRFLEFYPNPVESGQPLHIFLSRVERGDVQVFDVTGRLVSELPVRDVTEVALDLGTLPAGTYLVRFTGKSGSVGNVLVVL